MPNLSNHTNVESISFLPGMINFFLMPENIVEEKIPDCCNHPENEAIGSCFACGKFLCQTCGEWFKERFYCVACYVNVEMIHAQLETPVLQNLKWYHAPDKMAAFLFISFCLIIAGLFLTGIQEWFYGGILIFSGWVILMMMLPIVNNSPALTPHVKHIFTYLLYSFIFAILLLILFLGLLKSGLIHLR